MGIEASEVGPGRPRLNGVQMTYRSRIIGR